MKISLLAGIFLSYPLQYNLTICFYKLIWPNVHSYDLFIFEILVPLHYSCMGNPMDRGAWWLQNMGSKRISHGLATEHTYVYTHVEMWGTYPYFYSLVLPSSGIHI